MSEVVAKAVANGFRRLVLALLYTDGPMNESDILKHVAIKSDLLAYHLNVLIDANMIERGYHERYSLKEEGYRFLTLINATQRLDKLKNKNKDKDK